MTLLELVKNGATVEPHATKGIHITIGDKQLWTAHTEDGLDIWTHDGGANSNSHHVKIGLNMLDLIISEINSRLQSDES